MNKAWKNNSLQVMKFVYWHSTYSLSVLNMGSIRECRQLKKLVYLHLTYSLSVQNMHSKHNLRKVIK